MTRLTDARGALAHDDRLDALTMAVEYFATSMDRDYQTGMEERIDELLDQWSDPDRGIFYVPELQNVPPKKVGRHDYRGLTISMLRDFRDTKK